MSKLSNNFQACSMHMLPMHTYLTATVRSLSHLTFYYCFTLNGVLAYALQIVVDTVFTLLPVDLR